MTKEEILWSFPQGESEPYGHAPVKRIYEAMDNYAKQEAISFGRYLESEMINFERWGINMEEMYNNYLKQKSINP